MPTKKVVKKGATKKVEAKPTKKVVARKVVAKKVAKKAVASKPVKKAATKSAVTKSVKKVSAKKPLVVAPDQASFWVKNGQILNSLIALRDAFGEMEKEVFQYHTAKEQNDFAEWVANVLQDTSCAKDLAKAGSPTSAKTVVVKHLKLYSV